MRPKITVDGTYFASRSGVGALDFLGESDRLEALDESPLLSLIKSND